VKKTSPPKPQRCIEKLTGPVSTRNTFLLEGLSCRNLDKIVHVNISVDWASDALSQNDAGRFVFWTSESEFLFPQSKVIFLHGSYLVNGYFIARSGGTHQGVTSMAFEKVEDASVMLNPSVKEVPAKRVGCR
jgi:hypothetical protein